MMVATTLLHIHVYKKDGVGIKLAVGWVVGVTRVAQSHYIFRSTKINPQGTTQVLLAGLDVGYADGTRLERVGA